MIEDPKYYYLRTPLDYQITEYDCGTVTLLNAIRYLFDRKEISPLIYKEIMQYTLDLTDENGEYGKGGTSNNAMLDMITILNVQGPKNKMNILCSEISDIEKPFFKDQINDGGAAILRVYQKQEHYVLLTKIDDEYAYLFDPYYLPIDYYDNDKEVEIIKDCPFGYNRKVSLNRLIDGERKDFALVKNRNKQIILIKRGD